MHKRVGAAADEGWEPDRAGGEVADDGGFDGRFRLAVADLIPGNSDEVVLFNDSAVREVVLESEDAPIAEGAAETHVTGDGVDVSGFRFVRFPNGPTLFYDPDTRVRIDRTRRRSA